MKKNQIDIITLGCSKNLVDSELLMKQFEANGYHCVHDSKRPQGEIAVINTCGFIEDAKQESIDTILEFIQAKEEGRLRKLYVMGCLSQRYQKELEEEMPEVDKFYGKFNYKQLLQELGKAEVSSCNGQRHLTTPRHYAYIKIAEGCNRHCAYCAIPIITGKHVSRPKEEILQEVRELVGINAMLYSQTGSYSGYGFAIPTSIMNKVVDDLKKYGSVQRVMLSIQGSDVLNYINAQKENGKDVNLGTNEGVYIAKVDEDGNGADAGLKEGDVITKVDGKKVTKMAELQEILNGKRPGDKMSITYLRNKKASTKTITLKNAQGNTSVIKSADLDVLGGSFRPITESQKNQLNIKYGVEVMKVNNGALKDGGISRGFIIQRINDNNITSLDDLQKAVKSASTSKDPVLYIQGIWPTGKKAYFAVPLQKD